jgi:putative DNA primase/helicase
MQNIPDASEIINRLGPARKGKNKCLCPVCGNYTLAVDDNPNGGSPLLHCWICEQPRKPAILAALRSAGLWPRYNNGAGTNGGKRDDRHERLARALSILDATTDEKPTAYLRSRGITITPEEARILPRAATYRLPVVRRGFPAMVFAVYRDLKVCGIHLTWLCRDGSAKLATEDRRKQMFGPVKGGFILLGTGGGSDPDQPLIIGEGIESTLSAMQLARIPLGLSAMSAGNMPEIEVPGTGEVIIAADHDEPGIEAANALAQRLVKQGRKVRIAHPQEQDSDWNDVLMKRMVK